MICKECRQKISLFLDGELSNEEKRKFEAHIEKCSGCKKELEEIENIVKELNEIPFEKLPEGYCKKLHQRLIESKTEKKQTFIGKLNWKRYSAIAAALALLLMAPLAMDFLSMNNMKSTQSIKEESYYESPSMGILGREENGMTDSEKAQTDGDYSITSDFDDALIKEQESAAGYRSRELKIVKTGYISMETEEYDVMVAEIKNKILYYGGYIENSETFTNNYSYYDKDNQKQVYLKNGYLRVRIPQDKFDEAYGFVSESGVVVSERSSEEDMTKYYYDIENNVINLEAQEQRLRELLNRAENITEIMQIENELSRVRSQIDSYKMNLSDIDYRTSMATIYIEVREIASKSKISPVDDNLWTRAKESFTESINYLIRSFENAVVFIFGAIPALIIIMVLLVVAGFIAKKMIKRFKK
jgi:hypothetical protein